MTRTPPVRWERTATDGRARTGVLHTPHGAVPTPAFMPVGTRAAVKTVDSGDLERIGADIVLANTYHLMLRPGEDVIAALGELHGFMAWPHPILTDSGGYQVFSLAPDIDEQGVVFRSTYDGSRVELTPERAVAVQEALGSDIAMMLDVLVGLPADRPVVEAAMERTMRWGRRALAARSREDRALFGIVQGGVDAELRARSAAATAALEVDGVGFEGFGIGGLSVGEERHEMAVALDAAIPELPPDAPRYVMGLGDTTGIIEAVARGADMFDCVLPTRLARHGKVLSSSGDYSIRRAEWAKDDRPLDESCGCEVCARYPRGYVRHLMVTKEITGGRLLTLHNLAQTLDLLREVRRAIGAGTFDDLVIRRGLDPESLVDPRSALT